MLDTSKMRPRLQAIRSVWDNDGATADRYTVLFKDGTYLAMSDNPDHLQMGISQFGHGEKPGDHLGQEIKLSELPLNVLHHLIRRLES